MPKDIKQNQKSGDNCINQQAGHDINIYQGISETELDKRIEEKCKNMSFSMQQQICEVQQQMLALQNNLIEKNGIAQQKQQFRCEIFGKTFVFKLLGEADDRKEKIFKAFEEPAMQEAAFKAQLGYIISGDDDHLNILTNMLIDRGNISQRTNKQMLIDDAIDTLSKLNQKHLDILGYILLRGGVNQSGTLNILDSYINNLVKYMKKIIPLSKENNDFVYLKHRNCLQTPVFSDYQGIETYIFRQTQAFNEGFEKSEILEELNNNAFENFFIPSLKNPNKYVLKFNSFELIEKYVSQDGLLQALEKIKKFYIPYKSGQVNKSEVYDIILKRHPDASILFNNDIKNFSYYNLTPLGQLIAIEYVSQDVDKDFLWDFE